MKQLIVTADDAGLHPGMTDGALRAHDQGIVTAVSISACGADVERAVESFRDRDVDVGVHFTLVEEEPVLRPREVSSLVGRRGRFHPSYGAVAARWMIARFDLDEVEAELRAQAARLVDGGLRLVHANGHQHLHVLPGVVDRVIAVCRAFGIRYVRTPRDVWSGAPRFGFRVGSMNVLRSLASGARRRVLAAGLASNDRTIGIANAGHLTRDSIERLLPHVTDVTELVTHPGLGSDRIAGSYRWQYEWERETAALCDAGLRAAIDRHGITLVRPSDVA